MNTKEFFDYLRREQKKAMIRALAATDPTEKRKHEDFKRAIGQRLKNLARITNPRHRVNAERMEHYENH